MAAGESLQPFFVNVKTHFKIKIVFKFDPLSKNHFSFSMKLKYLPLLLLVLIAFSSFQPNSFKGKFFAESPYYIVIDKSDYEMHIYDEEGWYATYPIVFGSKDLSDKMREGDKKTPNGDFTIIVKKKNPKWGPELLLDYPNAESYKKFNERKNNGTIPRNAKIGNGIAIHGTRPDEEWTIDNYYNWTDGCISVRYSEMLDLFNYIPVGTKVKIQP